MHSIRNQMKLIERKSRKKTLKPIDFMFFDKLIGNRYSTQHLWFQLNSIEQSGKFKYRILIKYDFHFESNGNHEKFS